MVHGLPRCLLFLGAAGVASLVACLYDVAPLTGSGGDGGGPAGFRCDGVDADFCCDFDENIDGGWRAGPFGTGATAYSGTASYGDGGVLGLSLDAYVSPPASGSATVPYTIDALSGALFAANLPVNHRSHLVIDWQMNVTVASTTAGAIGYFVLNFDGASDAVLYLTVYGKDWYVGAQDVTPDATTLIDHPLAPSTLPANTWIHLSLDLELAFGAPTYATLSRIDDAEGGSGVLLHEAFALLAADASVDTIQVGFGAASFAASSPAATAWIDNVLVTLN